MATMYRSLMTTISESSRRFCVKGFRNEIYIFPDKNCDRRRGSVLHEWEGGLVVDTQNIRRLTPQRTSPFFQLMEATDATITRLHGGKSILHYNRRKLF